VIEGRPARLRFPASLHQPDEGAVTIAEIWRYPVKSLAGERLESAELTTRGLAGDRIVHVAGADGRVITSRTHPRLLGLKGTLGTDGEPQVDGHPWRSPTAGAAARAAAGAEARLVRYEGLDRFDVLPLLVATDGAIASLGVDRRRLRPNIVIAGVDGLAERDWPGRRIMIGDAQIDVAKLRSRCVMTTFDPDTQEQDVSVLRRIVKEFGGRMALDCAIVTGGVIRVGDPVELMD